MKNYDPATVRGCARLPEFAEPFRQAVLLEADTPLGWPPIQVPRFVDTFGQKDLLVGMAVGNQVRVRVEAQEWFGMIAGDEAKRGAVANATLRMRPVVNNAELTGMVEEWFERRGYDDVEIQE